MVHLADLVWRALANHMFQFRRRNEADSRQCSSLQELPAFCRSQESRRLVGQGVVSARQQDPFSLFSRIELETAHRSEASKEGVRLINRLAGAIPAYYSRACANELTIGVGLQAEFCFDEDAVTLADPDEVRMQAGDAFELVAVDNC